MAATGKLSRFAGQEVVYLGVAELPCKLVGPANVNFIKFEFWPISMLTLST